MDRTLILGTGAVSGFGFGCNTLYEGIFAGEQSLRPRERLQDVDCLTEVTAEVPGTITSGHPAEQLPLQFAELAAREALAQQQPDPECALILASTKACMTGIGSSGTGYGQPARLAQALAARLNWSGPVHAVSAACASGLAALALAGRSLSQGRYKKALVVGSDALSPFILRGFSALLALDPGPCRPFDRDRRGLSLGEGAGAILLATQETQDSRGIALSGWGESNDANHITGPSRDGQGLARAITRALRIANLTASDVDFIHLHGTGTPYNDAMEQRALALVFDPIPACAGSKAQIGHSLGAAGILESLISIEALRRGTAPANVGYSSADTDAAFALSDQATQLQRSKTALKIAAGFGGINAAVTFQHLG